MNFIHLNVTRMRTINFISQMRKLRHRETLICPRYTTINGRARIWAQSNEDLLCANAFTYTYLVCVWMLYIYTHIMRIHFGKKKGIVLPILLSGTWLFPYSTKKYTLPWEDYGFLREKRSPVQLQTSKLTFFCICNKTILGRPFSTF